MPYEPSFPSMHPIDSSNTFMYRIRGCLGTSGISIGGFIRHCLTIVVPSDRMILAQKFKERIIGSSELRYEPRYIIRHPKKPQTCFSVHGSRISRMAFTLSGSTSIPFWLMIVIP